MQKLTIPQGLSPVDLLLKVVTAIRSAHMIGTGVNIPTATVQLFPVQINLTGKAYSRFRICLNPEADMAVTMLSAKPR